MLLAIFPYPHIFFRALKCELPQNVWNFQVTSENTIHMLWLSPQFFFMAIAELLVQVTLIDFSSSQVR